MAEAVVFQGLDALDYGGIRANVVRIPEVASRLLEAQEYWDKGGGRDFDLFNFVSSDDQTFLSNIRKKSLASAVVQLGLYDRYLRHHPVPQIFVGNSNGDPALLVVAGVWNFQELVTKSQALELMPLAPDLPSTQFISTPFLSGISLTNYAAYTWKKNERGEKISEEIPVDKIDPSKVISILVEKYGVRRFINVGPGNLLYPHLEADLRHAEIQVLESVDLDPMLSWFWQNLRHREMATA